ncbi:MAG: monovalent cation/H+ antiporter subunit D family protein [Deltaproteobacteria bacterium]|nr:monovalent cation/H+ antiporter subunit D family protein [Deltaproteobacteria bacterium]
MRHHYPALLVVVPLLSAFLCSGLGWIKRRLCFPVALLGLVLTTWAALGLLLQVLEGGPVQYRLGGWDAPWGIEYRVDHLNSLILALVSLLAFVNLVASRRSIEAEFPGKEGAFYTLYTLFVTGLMGIVVTGDLFNLYVLLEVTSLTGYALIALGRDPAPLASLNYVFIGTIGASFYLLGVGYLYIMTGSLNMADVAGILPRMYGSGAVVVAFIFCMVGIWIKMAFFPLHVWLPNAYTYAPSAASGLIAPLMTKVMVYVMIRIMLSVFTPLFSFGVLALHEPMVWMATLAVLAGALLALAQTNLKRMLCYILVSEIGYMVGGMWLGNRAGLTGAVLHIVNDALMTLCLFLVASNIVYRIKGLDRGDLKGLFHRMPFTMAALVTGALSIIGVPPTCGFFSKWYLISGAIQAGHYGFMAALLASSLINAILFFRVFELAYFEPLGKHQETGNQCTRHEAPFEMLAPLLAVAAGLVLVGLYTGDIVTLFIDAVIPEGWT